jgi:2,3-bisphosphoglycerate-dependent phosphoglycerate mutase
VTRLHLIRHGESVAQVEGYVSGHDTCRGLSPLGRRQASALRDRLSRSGEIRADVILTSHLQRAIETAEIIAPALGGADLVQDCDLCELHPGEAEGLTFEEAQARWPGDPWGPGMSIAPGGERWDEFETRVARAIGRYAEAHAGQTIVAVVHGGVIANSFTALVGSPVLLGDVRNTSLTEWSFRGTPWTVAEPSWHLERHNDAAHLEGVQ